MVLKFCEMFKKLFGKKSQYNPENESSVREVTKLLDSSHVPIIEGVLNGKKAYFMLDTGASISVLDTNQSKDYMFSIIGDSDVEITGIGSNRSESKEIGKSLVKVGESTLKETFIGKDLRDVVRAVSSGSGYNIVGIIGTNNIWRNSWVLDFKRSKIVTYD